MKPNFPMAFRGLIKPLIFLMGVTTIVSCSKSEEVIAEPETYERPFVDFDIVPGEDPFTFKFENKSLNYDKLEWRFGDDSLSSDVSPSHLYMRDGVYEVNLQATSKDGSIARKLLKVNVNADSIFKLSATKTGIANQVRFGINTDADIASSTWSFGGEGAESSTSPIVTFAEGSLNPFTLKVVTNNGSISEITKLASTEGIVSNVTYAVSLQVTKDNAGGQNANEGSLKLIDNNIDTKLYLPDFGNDWTMRFTFAEATAIKFYGLGSANDSQDRDPKTWTLEGSNDGQNWTLLDTRSLARNFYDQSGGKYKQMFYYAVANPKPYLYYRYHLTANFGSSAVQFSEFRLFK